MIAYIAGLVVGDGHVEKRGRVVIVSKSKIFLAEIGSFVPYKHSIFYDRRAGVWKISWNSKELTAELESIGVRRGNKTTANMSITVRDNQMSKFVAGLYDAEGHFEVDERKGVYFKVRIKMKNASIMRLVYAHLGKNKYEPRRCEKDGCFVVDINKQVQVARFLSSFMLFHEKWRRLRSAFRDRRPEFPGVTRGLQCVGQWDATP